MADKNWLKYTELIQNAVKSRIEMDIELNQLEHDMAAEGLIDPDEDTINTGLHRSLDAVDYVFGEVLHHDY